MLMPLPEVPAKGGPEVDLDRYVSKLNKVEYLQVVRVKSAYSRAADGRSHFLKTIGAMVESIQTDDGLSIEFRPSELLALEEDGNGKLLGLPKGKKSRWQRFCQALKITRPTEAIGKELPIKIVEKSDGKQFLGYLF